ncbi:MAG TPA: FISUMP domain-containing protein [Prolixibacteraceae bacterium]|nr:FISUMP domain-containing protein [Prolixibacteraceae bacterium]
MKSNAYLNHSRRFSLLLILLALVSLLGINSCQKIEDNPAQNLSMLKSATLSPNYLQDLITSINSMVESGELGKGEGQSLIAKVDNAIKSIEKGNTNAVNGQLDAFNSEVEYFVDNGTLTSEQGESLTDVADFVVDFPDGSFTDPRDGQKYSVVLIGNQVWMGENLKANKFNDGSNIPHIANNDIWNNISAPGFSWYNNDETAFKNTYGALYNWHAVGTGKLSPVGWHIPSDTEWTTLLNFLGGSFIAGGKLKETGTTHWLSPNDGATNEFGFTALPGGARNLDGSFAFLGGDGHWWSSTANGSGSAWLYYISNSWSGVSRISPSKNYEISVRCIKD